MAVIEVRRVSGNRWLCFADGALAGEVLRRRQTARRTRWEFLPRSGGTDGPRPTLDEAANHVFDTYWRRTRRQPKGD